MTNVERPRIVVGNWKMNLGGDQAPEWAERLLSQVAITEDAPQLAVLPPFTAIHHFQRLRGNGARIPYGAQDLSSQDDGALTGDISGSMLADLGCEYVLAGHSERREHHAETDAEVNAKIQAALRHGLTPILCVGEGLEVRQQGGQVRHSVTQLWAALEHVPRMPWARCSSPTNPFGP
jgi:triosephosphate isomerase